ncbi:type II toxin-antitoxin system VapC family toxin [Candidatus Daviesbacteria bacterium]|nr:type II toxin-antitoxin system VapC family toxin [Candidatus Daviesbacteria bacterium]
MAASGKKYIVDASFVLSFLLPDEKHEDVDQFFNQYKGGIIDLWSTALLPFEVVNGLKLAVDRKRISTKYAKERMREFFDYGITLYSVNLFEVFDLSQKHELTIYDAGYYFLAKQEKTHLLTKDEKLDKLK